MRKNIILLAAAFTLGLGGLALAGKSEHSRRTEALKGEKVPMGTIIRTLEEQGYRVVRAKTDDGCYEIRAVNDSGYPIEATYNRADGELVRAKLK